LTNTNSGNSSDLGFKISYDQNGNGIYFVDRYTFILQLPDLKVFEIKVSPSGTLKEITVKETDRVSPAMTAVERKNVQIARKFMKVGTVVSVSYTRFNRRDAEANVYVEEYFKELADNHTDPDVTLDNYRDIASMLEVGKDRWFASQDKMSWKGVLWFSPSGSKRSGELGGVFNEEYDSTVLQDKLLDLRGKAQYVQVTFYLDREPTTVIGALNYTEGSNSFIINYKDRRGGVRKLPLEISMTSDRNKIPEYNATDVKEYKGKPNEIPEYFFNPAMTTRSKIVAGLAILAGAVAITAALVHSSPKEAPGIFYSYTGKSPEMLAVIKPDQVLAVITKDLNRAYSIIITPQNYPLIRPELQKLNGYNIEFFHQPPAEEFVTTIMNDILHNPNITDKDREVSYTTTDGQTYIFNGIRDGKFHLTSHLVAPAQTPGGGYAEVNVHFSYNLVFDKDDGRVKLFKPSELPRNSPSSKAMTVNQPFGGIDFNSVNLNLQIKRDGNGVPLPLALQDMNKLMQVEGFIPEIIEIKPAVNLPILSELQQKLQASSSV
jgi:hypothetical protein